MKKLSRLLLCAVLAGLTTAWAIAQDSDTDAKSKGEVRSITGCVTKGPSATEFLLTASDGSTWEGGFEYQNAQHEGRRNTVPSTVT